MCSLEYNASCDFFCVQVIHFHLGFFDNSFDVHALKSFLLVTFRQEEKKTLIKDIKNRVKIHVQPQNEENLCSWKPMPPIILVFVNVIFYVYGQSKEESKSGSLHILSNLLRYHSPTQSNLTICLTA